MRYYDKKPLEKSLSRQHWNGWHGRVRKAKTPYESEKDANKFISVHKLKGYVSYLCRVCGKWHIGHG